MCAVKKKLFTRHTFYFYMHKKIKAIIAVILILFLIVPLIYFQTQPDKNSNLKPISDNQTPSGNFTLPTEDEDDGSSDIGTGDIVIDDNPIDDDEDITISENIGQGEITIGEQDPNKTQDNISQNDISIEETDDISIENTEQNNDIVIGSDKNIQNFNSQEILVKTDNLLPENKNNIISQHDDTYVLAFNDPESAKQAYGTYFEQDNDFVAPNINLRIQDDTQENQIDSTNNIVLAETYQEPETQEQPLDILNSELKHTEPIKTKQNVIAVIDTGSDINNDQIIENISMLGDDGIDHNGHGSKIIKTITDIDTNAKIVSIKALDDNGYGNIESVYAGIKYAIEKQVDIINLSLAGYSIAENQAVTNIIQEAIKSGIYVIGAAGNYNADVKNFIPGNIPDIYTIGAAKKDGSRQPDSNYGETIDFNVVADSTSIATAYFTGKLSKTDINTIKTQLNQDWIFEPDYKHDNRDTDIIIEDQNTQIESGFKAQFKQSPTGMYEIEDYDYIIRPSALTLSGVSLTKGGSYADKIQLMRSSTNAPYIGYNGSINGSTAGNRHANCHYNVDFGYNFPLNSTWVEIVLPNAVESANEQLYDLGIKMSSINIMVQDGFTSEKPGFLKEGGGLWMSAYSYKDSATKTAISMNVTYTVYIHGSKTPVAGKLLLSWVDIDTKNCHGQYGGYSGEYQECIQLIDGIYDTVFIDQPTKVKTLTTSKTNDTYIGTAAANEESDSGISVLGYANGATIHWEGWNGCGTNLANKSFTQHTIKASKSGSGTGTITNEGTIYANRGSNKSYIAKASAGSILKSLKVDGTELLTTPVSEKDYTFRNIKNNHEIIAVFEPGTLTTPVPTATPEPEPDPPATYTQSTYVYHQQANGSYDSGTCVDSQTITEGGSYSYTWSRNYSTEPTNVYGNASPSSIYTGSVTQDNTYAIYVPRHQYTYSFNANPPSGHNASEIQNKQSNITKYAQNYSGNVNTPSLTGYLFKGWNTSSSGNGSSYANESMLSNKTFYAIWEPLKYYIRYNDNGASEPNKLEGEFTQNVVTTNSGMPSTQCIYDQNGTLRTNDFVRSGYDFIGWNTRADGTGTAFPNSPYNASSKYSDGYNRILNATTTPNATLDLYAQWRKKLGTETLTIISEETGNPVPNTYFRLYKQVNGTWISVPGMEVQKTNSNGQITVTDLHWFNYRWQATEVPTGYQTPDHTPFMITHNKLKTDETTILYMIRTNITLKTQVEDIIRGENPPAFMYHISGYDVAGKQHDYNIFVNTSLVTKTGEKQLINIFAGQYSITQTPVSRYNPGNAQNVINGSINGINAHVTPFTVNGSSVTFPYTIKQYGGFGSYSNQNNRVTK